MNAAEAARDIFRIGQWYECVENTYIPGRAGYRIKVEKVGKTFADGRGGDGMAFRLNLPSRVRDVLDVTADQVRYRIEPPGGGEHSVTWRAV